MTIGIPYAFPVPGKKNTVECPVCKEHIVLVAEKDFESRSGAEYQRHYAEKHAGAKDALAKADVAAERAALHKLRNRL